MLIICINSIFLGTLLFITVFYLGIFIKDYIYIFKKNCLADRMIGFWIFISPIRYSDPISQFCRYNRFLPIRSDDRDTTSP